MNIHMYLERVPGGKRRATFTASVWLLARVRPHVVLQVLFASECFAAYFARLRPTILVYVSVLFKVSGKTKSLSTNLTLIRLLPSVSAHVPFQTRLVTETSLAKVTDDESILLVIIEMLGECLNVGALDVAIKTL